MDPSTAQNQAMATHSLEDMFSCPKPQQEKRSRPQPEQALKCPRCDSTNTKFCYYNNYSLSQPRYFCKGCRRYWTQGGTLRNVPVGGGCRKNKKSSSSKRTQDQALPSTNSNPLPTLPSLTYDSNDDLTLAFARLHKKPTSQLGLDDHETSILGNLNTTNPDTTTTPGFLDTSSGFQNLCYGFGNGNMGDLVSVSGEMVLPLEEMGGATTATTKQGFCKERDGENRISWGFPWQVDGEGNMVAVDSGRECWNGLVPSWYGLVNSPLM